MNLDFICAVLNDPFVFGLSLLDLMLIVFSLWLFGAGICMLAFIFAGCDDDVQV